MADIYWKRAVSAMFGKAGAWMGGSLPGPVDDAILEASGAAYTVTSSRTETVNSIQLAANATLNITAHNFTAIAGTGTGANAGTIGIYGTAVLSIGGTMDNSGVISLNNTGSSEATATTLIFASNTTLTGGSSIELSNSFYNNIIGNGTILTNVDNFISGAGTIGSTKLGLTLVNDAGGVIDGTGTSGNDNFLIGPLGGRGGFVTNNGLIEGTGAGGLSFEKMIIDGSSGMILAGSGSSVSFGACTVTGQSITSQAGGNVAIFNSTVLTTTVATNGGHINVYSGHFEMDGGVNNSGIMIVHSGILTIGAAVTGAGYTLIYGGKLECDSSFNQNVVFGSSNGTGTLLLGQSRGYTGDISGFSATGASTLDLRDIGFASAGEASFSGTSSSGVLTVTDGTHTAHINLFGDYLSSHFVASTDSHGGAIIVAEAGAPAASPAKPATVAAQSTHSLVQALASLTGASAATPFAADHHDAVKLLLAAPRMAIA